MKDFRPGFGNVLAIVEDQHKERTGSVKGARAWLARQLGVSRQNLDNWQKRNGFPYRLSRKITRITGLSEAEIWPGGIEIAVEFPVELWNDVVKAAEDIGRPAPEAVVDLVKVGLKHR